MPQFNSLIAPKGVLVVGDPEEVAEKLLRRGDSSGGVDRFAFQIDNARLSHEQLLPSIALIGRKAIPLIRL